MRELASNAVDTVPVRPHQRRERFDDDIKTPEPSDLEPLQGEASSRQHLAVDERPVNDAGMIYFKHCKDLTDLCVDGTEVTDTSKPSASDGPKPGRRRSSGSATTRGSSSKRMGRCATVHRAGHRGRVLSCLDLLKSFFHDSSMESIPSEVLADMKRATELALSGKRDPEFDSAFRPRRREFARRFSASTGSSTSAYLPFANSVTNEVRAGQLCRIQVAGNRAPI